MTKIKTLALVAISLSLVACSNKGSSSKGSSSDQTKPASVDQASQSQEKSSAFKSSSTDKTRQKDENQTRDESSKQGVIQGRTTISTSVSSSEAKDQATSSQEESSTNPEQITNPEEFDPLAGYSDLEIEYARIWIQLGPNPDVEELYVRVFPEGTPINPNLEGSAVYPEEVTQISGSRLVDGVITYSSNGDGTINIYYQVPKRFEMPNENITEEIHIKETFNMAANTRTVYIDPSDPDRVISYINRIVEYPKP